MHPVGQLVYLHQTLSMTDRTTSLSCVFYFRGSTPASYLYLCLLLTQLSLDWHSALWLNRPYFWPVRSDKKKVDSVVSWNYC